jgi:hypothetical protein
VEAVASRALTMRDLLTRARERFGPEAARLKTREELMAALGLGSPSTAPGERAVGQATAPPEVALTTPLPPGPAVRELAPPLVVCDFFVPRRG